MSGALEGVRVLDLSQGAAGPTCAMLLGDLGADVVKVEPPGGEWGRGLGPPFVGGVAAAFLGMNRNKRSIVVDLKRPEGREVVLRLAAASDVSLESFRPGVAERLGIGYEAMAARNPRLVYAAVSAFGQEGPWRDLPGVDGVVQAMSGLMSVTGAADGPPVKVGVPGADMVGGLFAAQAILAATRQVYGREPNVFPWMAGSSTTWYFTRVGTPAVGGPGVGWTGQRIHAPNENIRLADARNAIKTTAALIATFSGEPL